MQDAMRRWAAKNGYTIEKAMSGRSIELMVFPDRECVQFQLSRMAVGGVPIYCYKIARTDVVPQATTQLVYQYTDVE